MKRILALVLAAFMLLAIVACTAKPDSNATSKDANPQVDPEVTPTDDTHQNASAEDQKSGQNANDLTAQEVLDQIKKSLGDSYASDTAETEDRISGYYGLDLSKIESWAAESNSMFSLNMDCAVVLKVSDGYAEDAAALLQQSYEQVLSYARMYNMDLQRVLNARLFVSGNYVALLIEGAQGDWQASDEEQAKFAAEEAAKVDAAWSEIFDSANNSIVIPDDSGNINMDEELEGAVGTSVLGG